MAEKFWHEYPDFSGEIADGDTFLFRDLSDATESAAYGSINEVPFSLLKQEIMDQFIADPSEADQGATGGGDTIKALVDSIGAETAIIKLRHSGGGSTTSYVLSTNETIPANIFLDPDPGAIIVPDAGVTLTVYSPQHIIASPRQVIVDPSNNSTNPLVFTTGGKVYPEWFDVDGTSDHVQVEAACTSLPSTGGRIELWGPAYSFAGVVTPKNYTEIYISRVTTITHANSTATNTFDVSSTTGVKIYGEGIIDGNNTNQSGTDIDLNCIIYGDTSVIDLHISGLEIKDAWSSGIRLKDANDIHIENCYFHGNAYYTGRGDDTVSCPGGAVSPAAINIREASYRIKILHNTIEDNWQGIRLENTGFYDVVINANEIQGNMRAGVVVRSDGGTDSIRVNVANNVFHANGDDAVWFYAVNISSVVGNSIQSFINGGNTAGYDGGYGVELRECSEVVAHNAIQTCANASVALRGCLRCEVLGSVTDGRTHGVIVTDSTNDGLGTASEENKISVAVSGCEANGIRVIYSDYTIVQGCNVKDNGEGGSSTPGIFVSESNYTHITGNKVRNAGIQEPGIQEASNSDYTVIEGNFVHGHTDDISPLVGANSKMRNNTILSPGPRSGQATLLSGQASVNVTAGALKSGSSKIFLTIQETDTLTAGEYLKVESMTPGSDLFTVKTGDEGNASGDIIFNWMVID
jgi:hypothetical protein